ncbi:MAG: NAD(P)H-binding protein, partial [Huintestinicola sp.]
MKIAVICANGKAGQLITEEAVNRGLDVTAVVRGENKSAAKNVIVKDLFDLTADDLKGFDAVVDAFGAWTPETIPQIPKAAEKLC